MRIALTGTPGTGKTTVANHVQTDLEVIHLNDVIQDNDLTTGTDADRDSVVADVEAVQEWIEDRDDVLVESHLAHYLTVDKVIVLRCAPHELETRLRSRNTDPTSLEENIDSERLDVILIEALDRHGEDHIYEIDTTDLEPAPVATEVQAVIDGDREPSAGTVSFLES